MQMNTPQELYACLYISDFPSQTFLRLNPELENQPCVVLDGEPPFQQVCALNNNARHCGLELGMACVEIDAFSSINIFTRDLQMEAVARRLLMECAGAFSPRIEDLSRDNSFLCCLDIAGTNNLVGAPESLAQALLARVNTLSFKATITVSHNFHAAVCLAKGLSSQNKYQVIAAGHESSALEHLQLSVLGLTEQQLETFTLWGIHTLGMLAALPEKELIARIEDGQRLRQMARGELPHLMQPKANPFRLEDCIDLDTPVETLDSLLFVISTMLDRLLFSAHAHLVALAAVSITLSLRSRVMHTRTVRPAIPTNDKQVWVKLLHLDLEAHPPQDAIVAVVLQAEPGTTSDIQLGIFSPQMPDPASLDVTLARIRALVSDTNVGRAVLKDTYAPDAFRLEPFTISCSKPETFTSPQKRTAMRRVRPTEAISVTLHNASPALFVFREHQYKVERVYGPWLAEGDWWNQSLWGYEQWDLIARARDGALLCCCIVRDLMQQQWQLVSLYD